MYLYMQIKMKIVMNLYYYIHKDRSNQKIDEKQKPFMHEPDIVLCRAQDALTNFLDT